MLEALSCLLTWSSLTLWMISDASSLLDFTIRSDLPGVVCPIPDPASTTMTSIQDSAASWERINLSSPNYYKHLLKHKSNIVQENYILYYTKLSPIYHQFNSIKDIDWSNIMKMNPHVQYIETNL